LYQGFSIEIRRIRDQRSTQPKIQSLLYWKVKLFPV